MVNNWPISESRKGTAIFYVKHKGFGKVLARIGRRIIRDKLLKQATVKKLQFPMVATTTPFACLVICITFQMASPSFVRSRSAIAICFSKRSLKPVLLKETWVDVIPSVCVLVANRIAESHPGLVGLMRQIAWQIDNAWSITSLAIMTDLFKNISSLTRALRVGYTQLNGI